MRGARTPERDDYMRAHYPGSTDPVALSAGLAALPGPPIPSPGAVRAWAKSLHLTKTPEAQRAIMQAVAVIGGKAAMAARGGKPIYDQAGKHAAFAASQLTEPRKETLRRLWPDASLSVAEVFAEMNKSDPNSPPTTSKKTLYRYVQILGLPTPRFPMGRKHLAPKPVRRVHAVDLTMARPGYVEAIPEPPRELSPAEQDELVTAKREAKHRRAIAMLGKRGADPAHVAAVVGIKHREARMLMGMLRMGLTP